MKKARGEAKRLLIVIGEIQDKVGLAHGLHYNDVNPTTFERAQNLLQEVFDLCVDARSDYDPILRGKK